MDEISRGVPHGWKKIDEFIIIWIDFCSKMIETKFNDGRIFEDEALD